MDDLLLAVVQPGNPADVRLRSSYINACHDDSLISADSARHVDGDTKTRWPSIIVHGRAFNPTYCSLKAWKDRCHMRIKWRAIKSHEAYSTKDMGVYFWHGLAHQAIRRWTGGKQKEVIGAPYFDTHTYRHTYRPLECRNLWINSDIFIP